MQKKKGPWIDLEKLRNEKGWNQTVAAEKLKFSRSYLSSIEYGRRGFSIKMIEKIIEVFDVKYEDFYSKDDSE